MAHRIYMRLAQHALLIVDYRHKAVTEARTREPCIALSYPRL